MEENRNDVAQNANRYSKEPENTTPPRSPITNQGKNGPITPTLSHSFSKIGKSRHTVNLTSSQLALNFLVGTPPESPPSRSRKGTVHSTPSFGGDSHDSCELVRSPSSSSSASLPPPTYLPGFSSKSNSTDNSRRPSIAESPWRSQSGNDLIRRASSRSLGNEFKESPSDSLSNPISELERTSSSDSISSNSSWTDPFKTLQRNAVFRPRVQATGDKVVPRMLHSAVIWEDFMFVFGGISTSPPGRWNDIKSFHFSTRTWSDPLEKGGIKPSPRFGHSGVVYNDSMWIFGGEAIDRDFTPVISDEFWQFNFVSQTWKIVSNEGMGNQVGSGGNAPLGITLSKSHVFNTLRDSGSRDIVVEKPVARTGHTAVIWDKSMIIFGGMSKDGEYFNDIWEYRFLRGKWFRLICSGSIPSCRAFHSTVVRGDSIFIFGGKGSEPRLGDFYELKLGTKVWSQLSQPVMPSPRSNHSMVFMNDSIFISGGDTQEMSRYLDVFEFDFAYRKWFKVITTAECSRNYMSCVVRNGILFYFGGGTSPVNTSNTLCYLRFGDLDFEEQIELDESSKMAKLPPTLWEATALKRHPEVLSFIERVKPISNGNNFGSFANPSKTESGLALSAEQVLQLILEYLHRQKGFEKVIETIQSESSVRYIKTDREGKETRLYNLLRVAHRRVRRKPLFGPDITIADYDDVDPEVPVVSHLRHNDEEEAWVNSWDEPDDTKYFEVEEVNGQPVIKLATLNKLIVLLTWGEPTDSAKDLEFVKMFLTMYTTFTSSDVLLEKLIERYDVDEDLLEDDAFNALPIVKSRICNVLQLWVDRFGWDFASSQTLQQKLRSFIDGFLSRDGNIGRVKQLKNSLDRFGKKREDEVVGTAPEVKVNKNLALFMPDLNWFTLDEIEIARQLTIIDFNIFSRIQPSELFKQRWSNPELKHMAPRLVEMRERQAMLSNWVTVTILQSENKKMRAKVVEKFIKVADYLNRLKNYHTLYSILNGISHYSVTRLTQSLSEMQPRFKDVMESSVALMGKEDAFKGYKDSSAVRLPRIDSILSVITEADNAEPDEIRGLINIQKLHNIYESVAVFQEIQQRSYNLQPVVQIARLFMNLPEVSTYEHLMALSAKAEP